MVTRKRFLDAKFPNYAYCIGGYHRGPSTKFNESLHITNDKIQLNIWWRCDKTVSLSVFDLLDKNEWTRNKLIICNSQKFSMKSIIKKCSELINESNQG